MPGLTLVALGGKMRNALSAAWLSTDTRLNASTARWKYLNIFWKLYFFYSQSVFCSHFWYGRKPTGCIECSANYQLTWVWMLPLRIRAPAQICVLGFSPLCTVWKLPQCKKAPFNLAQNCSLSANPLTIGKKEGISKAPFQCQSLVFIRKWNISVASLS